MAPRTKSLAERFRSKVDKSLSCWVWTGARLHQRHGDYGRISAGHRRGRILLAHRVSYEFSFGPIPDGMYVLHKCDNPPCVRPDHLFLGTQADNQADKLTKGRLIRKFGEENPNAKLTWQEVHDIRKRYASERASAAKLAAEFGVSDDEILNIIHEVTWRE